MEIRKMISKSLERGKVDFSLWIEKDVSDTATPINAALVENLSLIHIFCNVVVKPNIKLIKKRTKLGIKY